MGLLPKEQLQINNLIEEIKQDHDFLGLVRFGSSVHSSQYNDIDLAIITNKEISPRKELKYRIFLPEKYDVHLFHKLPIYIQAEILKNAIYEYVKDYDTVFDICVQSIKEFSLFEPHYKMFLESVLND